MEKTALRSKIGKTAVHVLWVLLVARIITGLTISNDLGSVHAWLSLHAWIALLGFAAIFAVVYWRNQSERSAENSMKP